MSLGEKSRFQIPLTTGLVCSLSWNGNELIDWAGGGRRFSLDGSEVRSNIHWAYRFDRAVSNRDGTYQVVYETLGTKGLVIKGNKIIREINRSFYHAHVYEFPVAIFDLPDGGGVGLAHCPDEYNELQIEEIESGRKLTVRGGKSPDFFHSRLQISPDGEYLVSAGWIWHPLDRVILFSLHEALRCPEHLDEPLGLELPEEFFEINTAAFQNNNTLLLIGAREEDDSGAPFVCRYNFKDSRIEVKSPLQSVPGTIMPVGDDHFVGFYEHPKLFEISSGKVIQSWPGLNSGKQVSSIIGKTELPPPLALDPENKRFAVASAKEITVVQLG